MAFDDQRRRRYSLVHECRKWEQNRPERISRVIKAFRSEWEGEQPELYVMDAAFYSEANLQEFGNSIEWISRVPATLKAAQELIESLKPEQFTYGSLIFQVQIGFIYLAFQWLIIRNTSY